MTRTHSTTPDINGSNPATHFGKQVHKERVARGWTIRDLSRESGLDPGHLSRIERGLSTPTEYAAAKLDKTFTHRKGWFSEYQRDSQAWTPPGYRHWAEYETPAALIRAWSPGGMNGLVQTEAYARALLATMPDVPEAVVETRLAGRTERQRRILHRENPPEVWILVDELALYREVGSPEVMAEQLDHLLAVAAMPNVTVQIVPATAHPAIGYGLVIADGAAYTEHIVQGYVYTEPETATSLTRLMSSLQAESYRRSESIQIIERVRDIWARGVNPLTAALTAGNASK
ncbi:MAG: helix-turn-helix transcriptional regulator [Nocardiopsaceae bacterium]|nr:helix-turn-helix transcriptional regulator [Nocardiopsaceae bacterium]